MQLGALVELLVLLLGDNAVGDRRPDSAGDIGALVVLERLGLVKVVKAPRAEVLERVAAVDMLPAPGQHHPNHNRARPVKTYLTR